MNNCFEVCLPNIYTAVNSIYQIWIPITTDIITTEVLSTIMVMQQWSLG